MRRASLAVMLITTALCRAALGQKSVPIGPTPIREAEVLRWIERLNATEDRENQILLRHEAYIEQWQTRLSRGIDEIILLRETALEIPEAFRASDDEYVGRCVLAFEEGYELQEQLFRISDELDQSFFEDISGILGKEGARDVDRLKLRRRRLTHPPQPIYLPEASIDVVALAEDVMADWDRAAAPDAPATVERHRRWASLMDAWEPTYVEALERAWDGMRRGNMHAVRAMVLHHESSRGMDAGPSDEYLKTVEELGRWRFAPVMALESLVRQLLERAEAEVDRRFAAEVRSRLYEKVYPKILPDHGRPDAAIRQYRAMDLEDSERAFVEQTVLEFEMAHARLTQRMREIERERRLGLLRASPADEARVGTFDAPLRELSLERAKLDDSLEPKLREAIAVPAETEPPR